MARGRARGRRIAALGSAVLLGGGVLAAPARAACGGYAAGRQAARCHRNRRRRRVGRPQRLARRHPGTASGRQRDRRGSGDGQHARGDRAVRRRPGWRRLHGDLPGQAAPGDHDRRARDVPGEVLAANVPGREGQAPAVRECAPLRVVGGRSGHGRDVGQGRAEIRPAQLRQRPVAGDSAGAARIRRRQELPPAGTGRAA